MSDMVPRDSFAVKRNQLKDYNISHKILGQLSAILSPFVRKDDTLTVSRLIFMEPKRQLYSSSHSHKEILQLRSLQFLFPTNGHCLQ